MQREHQPRTGGPTAGRDGPARSRRAVVAALALAVLLGTLILPGPATAADESATFRLTGIHEYWPGATPPPSATARLDRITHDANGGSIEFTERSQDSSADCVGKEQHFKFSWQFSRDVSNLSGRQGDTLFMITTKWEGDAGTKCVNENPFVWIRSGGSWGTGPGQGVTGETFKLAFVNPAGENRVYFDGSGSSNPTVLFNSVYYDNGGFMFTPAIRNLGAQIDIVYAYEKVPGAPTMTATTAPQTTVATTTTAPPATTAPGTTAIPATTTQFGTRVTLPPGTSTGGQGSGCSWTGTWQTDWGEMALSQSGNLVTGTYTWDSGTLEGAVSGNTLTGRWSEAPSYKEPRDAGQFVLTMAPDCKSFTGTLGYGAESTGMTWTGTRGGATVPATSATTVTTPPTTAPTTTAPTTSPPTTTVRTTTAPTTAVTTTSSGSSTTGRNTCPASGMLVYIDPWTPSPGQTIEIPVWVCNAQDLANMDLSVFYDPAVLTFISARKGGLLGSDFLFESNDLGGQVKISFAGTKGVSGSGAIAILTFRVAGATGSSTTLGPTVNTASNSNGGTLTVPTEGGTVVVKPPNPANPEGRPCGPTALTALKALQMAVNKIPMDMAYDVTRDGTVNSADARELLRLAADQLCVL